MTSINPTSLLAMRAQILQQNSALQKAAAGTGPTGPDALGNAGATKETDFGSALKGALGKVNDLQSKAGAISESYERGDTTDIAAVMLARQQASIGFQATLQVRNKLLAAYKDIMSMPV
jgi:flagellar hook-basal body complex protein FliE